MTTRQKITKIVKDHPGYNSTHDVLIDDLVYNLELMRKAKKEIKEHGLIIVNDARKVRNPAVMIYNQSATNVRVLLQSLDLKPASFSERGGKDAKDGLMNLLNDATS